MGMSTHCVGFRPVDKAWNLMKVAYDACEAAGIPQTEEVEEFFEGADPNDLPGKEVQLGDAVTTMSGDMQEGFDVDLTKVPVGVRIIRFYNSY